MDKYVIHGGTALKGSVAISGSKNASLPLMVASLLTEEDVTLRNVPNLLDVLVLAKLLEKLGKDIDLKHDVMHIRQKNVKKIEAPYELVKKMRASVIVLGPLLARYKHCRVSLPGGCAFGPRPIDLHIKGLEALGAKIAIDHGYIDAKAKSLTGKRIVLAGKFGSSVLATDNVMMAATLARGTTVIESAAMEPECVDLANMLISMGADITGAGTPVITVKGMKELHGTEYEVIPDRIETGTFLTAALATRGSIALTNCNPEHCMSAIDTLISIGATVKMGPREIEIKAKRTLKPFAIETMPYPMFPTDLQAQFITLGSTINGISSLTERVYPDRFMHVPELSRMGARIAVEGSTAIIHGGGKLIGCDVQASDLRAGAGLVVAGLAAGNTTTVHRIYHIDRGYEGFEAKLTSLGAHIKREKDTIL
ncbi:MAG: UDP-N-acetylglucosamine 1-carboxyvinyltransferase [Spirochaetota bacterium]